MGWVHRHTRARAALARSLAAEGDAAGDGAAAALALSGERLGGRGADRRDETATASVAVRVCVRQGSSSPDQTAA